MAKAKEKKTSSGILPADRYFNRELSWLEFNRRVLAEAANNDNPIIERLKFLAIFESNLDEFYMVRVSGLIEQFEGGITELTPDGLSPAEQLQMIYDRAGPMRQEAGRLLDDILTSDLAAAGINLRQVDELSPKQRADLEAYFLHDVFPVCTPLILHPTSSVPFISGRSLNLAVELSDRQGDRRLARVKIPNILPRVIKISPRRHEYVLLEDVVASHLHFLFPGVQVHGAHLFRVLRDADVEIRELEAADLIGRVEEALRLRRFGSPVRLDVHPSIPQHVYDLLTSILQLDNTDVLKLEGRLGLEFLWELSRIDKPNLKFGSFTPYLHEPLNTPSTLFEAIRKDDFIVHHPYDSFRPVETFAASAVTDPNVIGIKQTLYRVGRESPIVESLLEAAEEGKQVAVMVELKARFDESNNLVWARALERAGAHVSYGFSETKTHCKLCLIVRREQDGIRSYAHIGTGNYNPSTARLYTDFGLFTDDPEMTQDIAELFNYLTGFSMQTNYRKLLVAPLNLREGIIERIRRETQLHKKSGNGRILFKLNSLVDPEVIDELYDASQSGVKVDLIVRGASCLRPGVPGLSENIRVISIVGRFLEHSRAYYFENGGSPELYIGSADLMRRNLDRRVEVLAPVRRRELVKLLKEQALEVCLKDNVKAWIQTQHGTYERRQLQKGERPFDSHAWLMERPTSKFIFDTKAQGSR